MGALLLLDSLPATATTVGGLKNKTLPAIAAGRVFKWFDAFPLGRDGFVYQNYDYAA
jgi:hypothetical protein